MPVDVEGRDLSKPIICAEHQFFCVRLVVNVDFLESESAFAQKLLYAPAIAAPGSGINCYFSHEPLSFVPYLFDAGKRRTMPCVLEVISRNIYRLDAASTRTSARCKVADALSQSVSGAPVAFASSAWARSAAVRARCASISSARSEASASTITRSGSTSA